MSDRLDELQRQRALIQEHLAWLDREIAAESGGKPPAAVGKPALSPTAMAAPARPAAPRSSASVSPVHAAAAEEILANYQVEPQSLHNNVRRGCFMYFFLAFLLVGLCVLGLYLYSVRK